MFREHASFYLGFVYNHLLGTCGAVHFHYSSDSCQGINITPWCHHYPITHFPAHLHILGVLDIFLFSLVTDKKCCLLIFVVQI